MPHDLSSVRAVLRARVPSTALRLVAPMVALAAGCTGRTPATTVAAAVRTERAPVAPSGAVAAPSSLDALLARMTLDEKLGQLTQVPGAGDQTGPTVPPGGEADVRAGRVGSMLLFWGAARTRALQRVAVEESRLKIPLLFAQDVIHGWRTTFPVPLAMAATFDSAATVRAARIAATEAAAHGLHWTFAPMVDIARDPRWGRIVEGAGEDAYLGGVMAAAQVRGYQGDDLAADSTLAATVKHLAAYGGAEAGRDYNTVELSERTLWEVYLPPYAAGIRAGAATVMASFNEIGGSPAHASRWLLTDVLRERWRFGGLVVSDWTGVAELVPHGLGDSLTVATRALDAGVDIEMSSMLYRRQLPEALRRGQVPMAAVDSAVLRVLRLKQALGLFDDPYRYSDTTRERVRTLTPANRAASRAIAREAIVLLENRNATLPLRRGLRTIAVIGPLADDAKSVLGNWVGAGRSEDAVTVLAGLREASPASRLLVVRGTPVDTARTTGIPEAEAAARAADAVVLVLGEREDMSAEAASRTSIELPGSQLELAQRVLRAARAADPRKPVVTVLLNGRPLATPWLADSMPAVVESWFLGVEHGRAVADVLFGDVSPSGRLPVTVPRTTGQIPIYYNAKNTGRPADPANKYTSKYLDVPWTPLYPYGHGLSYTTFAYADLRVATPEVRAGDPVRVSVRVTNTGARAGDEVVQLYLRDDAASVTRPLRMLSGFRRVTLAPAESRTLTFTLAPEQLALYDLTMRHVIEPGTFTLWAGGSSAAPLSATFRVTGETRVLAPAPPRMR